jgi:hypothetical protein
MSTIGADSQHHQPRSKLHQRRSRTLLRPANPRIEAKFLELSTAAMTLLFTRSVPVVSGESGDTKNSTIGPVARLVDAGAVRVDVTYRCPRSDQGSMSLSMTERVSGRKVVGGSGFCELAHL